MKRGSTVNRLVDRWAGIPLVWAAAALRRRGQLPTREKVRRVGVLTSTTIGDTLLASSAISRLHALWPQAEIVFFAASGNRAAAEMLPGVHRIVEISLTKPWRSIRTMQAEKLDVMVDFSAWQRVTAWMTARSGAKFTAGFSREAQHRHAALDIHVEHRGDRHESENFAVLADALEAASGAPRTEFPLALRPEVFETPLDEKWREAVVFHCWATGANHALREWPEERWMELAAKLRERWPDMKLVLTAGPADIERAEALATKLHATVFDAPRGLPAVAVLLKHARLVVSVNTGTMHLAAIVGGSVIGLCGPTNERHWGPRGPRAIGLQAQGDDCGYLDLGWEFDRAALSGPCMERISVEQVLHAVHRLEP